VIPRVVIAPGKIEEGFYDMAEAFNLVDRHECPLIVAVGRAETAEFVRQSVDYFRAWTDRGFAGHLMVLDGHHHFSIMGEMSRRESPLHRAMLAQMGLALEPAR
jgi:hypothetical protein